MREITNIATDARLRRVVSCAAGPGLGPAPDPTGSPLVSRRKQRTAGAAHKHAGPAYRTGIPFHLSGDKT